MKSGSVFSRTMAVPICIGLALLSASVTEGATLDEIIANVKRASVSPTGYQVRVVQTEIERAALMATEEVAATVPKVMHQYVVVYDPMGRLTTRHVTAEDIAVTESLTAIQEDFAKATSGGIVRITMDMEKMLDAYYQMTGVQVTTAVKDDRQLYRISGEHVDGSGTTVWIDPATWSVVEIGVTFIRQPFSRMLLTYKSFGELLLPTRIVIDHHADGTRVIQDFGEYRFMQ